MRVLDLRPVTLAMELHLLTEITNECGGSITTRLVSEEDLQIQFRFTPPPPFRLIEPNGTIHDFSESPWPQQVTYVRDIHWYFQDRRGLSSEIAARFPVVGRG